MSGHWGVDVAICCSKTTNCVIALSCTWLSFTHANAEEPPAVVEAGEQTSTVDPLLLVGVSLLPTSAVTAGLGAALLRPEPRKEVCGVIGGCVTYQPERDAQSRALGAGLLGASVATGIVGLGATAAGAWLTHRGDEAGSGPLVPLGSWLTGMGLGTTAVGIGVLVGEHGDASEAPGGIALTAVGGVMSLTGISLFGVGASRKAHEGYRPRSEGRTSAGIALGSMGATVAPLAVLYCANVAGAPTGLHAAYGLALACLPSAIAATGLTAGGVVLWVEGAREAAPAAVPLTLRAGAAGIVLEAALP